MRVLLDECLPRGLKNHLAPHDVVTVAESGWSGKKNGELLRHAAGNVDVFVTVDKNLVHQQNVKGLSFGVVVLIARTNRLGDLLPLIPEILDALENSRPGQTLRVGG
jgi:predicted nuclease of predicted toxin-antitoxin system